MCRSVGAPQRPETLAHRRDSEGSGSADFPNRACLAPKKWNALPSDQERERGSGTPPPGDPARGPARTTPVGQEPRPRVPPTCSEDRCSPLARVILNQLLEAKRLILPTFLTRMGGAGVVQALGNSTSRRSWGEDELREGGVGVSSLREVTVVAAFSAPPPTLRCGLTRLGAPADCSLEELPPPPPPLCPPRLASVVTAGSQRSTSVFWDGDRVYLWRLGHVGVPL
uniref:Uncharacterized protein n=1 Tax=Rangifer tarandus platyrhynchus TaxID=3082113 RepID=A0ACB0ENQ4_RANTA|nr:unnamed protein product [Rangifer tarandus platyrhynchus]